MRSRGQAPGGHGPGLGPWASSTWHEGFTCGWAARARAPTGPPVAGAPSPSFPRRLSLCCEARHAGAREAIAGLGSAWGCPVGFAPRRLRLRCARGACVPCVHAAPQRPAKPLWPVPPATELGLGFTPAAAAHPLHAPARLRGCVARCRATPAPARAAATALSRLCAEMHTTRDSPGMLTRRTAAQRPARPAQRALTVASAAVRAPDRLLLRGGLPACACALACACAVACGCVAPHAALRSAKMVR